MITWHIISVIVKYRQSMNQSQYLTTFKEYFRWAEHDPYNHDGEFPALCMENPNWQLSDVWLNTRNATFSSPRTRPLIKNFLLTRFAYLIEPEFIYFSLKAPDLRVSICPPLRITNWKLHYYSDYNDQVALLPPNYYVSRLYL